MTPLLSLLQHWLRPPTAHIVLAFIYATLLVAIVVLIGYQRVAPVIYLDVR
jgi:hypothetical protein